MCGIAAIFTIGKEALEPRDRAAVHRMHSALAHRGPDGEGSEDGARYAIRFCRLAVYGGDGGRQPFAPVDGRIITAVNGEIYNHAELRREYSGREFSSASDCAVVHDLFPVVGTELFGKLRGMFATCIFDRETDQLHLVRDPFGIKPLFYSRVGDRIYVASELKGLFAGGVCAAPDWGAALTDSSFNLTGGSSVENGRTYFREATAVRPGGGVTIDLRTGVSREWTYWTPSTHGLSSTAHADGVQTWVGEYRRLLDQAVRRACMSDGPLSIFLSGGIDSVAVAALAARERDLTAWTVLSPSTVESGDFRASVESAHTLGIDLHWVDTCRAENEMDLDDWLWVLWKSETPLAGPEQFYKLLMLDAARELGQDCKVVLTGQGSDEFNGGYSTVVNLADDGSWAGFEAALVARNRRSLLDVLPGSLAALDDLVGPCVRREWLAARVEGLSGDPYDDYVSGKVADLQRFNCWHEDRVASAYGVESRPVFLDLDLVDHVLRVPPDLRSELLSDKRILREAVRDLLPSRFVERKKAPFFFGADHTVALGMLHRLLRSHGDDLIDMATAGTESGALLDAGALRSAIARAIDNPLGAETEQVLRIISLGSLEAMFGSPKPDMAPGRSALLTSASSTRQEDAAGADFGESRVMKSRVSATWGHVVVLRSEFTLLMPVTPQQAECATLLIARDSTILYEITRNSDPVLFAVLSEVQLPRQVKELADRTGLTDEGIRQAIDSLLRYSVVEFVEG